jgi:uncharacterized protein (TIGR03435 family)
MRVLIAAIVLVAAALAQTKDAEKFEVVSIRVAAPRNMYVGNMKGGPGSSDPTRFTWEYAPLRSIVMRAYGVPPFQLVGSGLEDQRFDIAAKVPAGSTPDGLNAMLRNLLIDRFGLKFHHENREMAVYELRLAKNGPKLKETDLSIATPDGNGKPIARPPDIDGFPSILPGTHAADARYRNGVMRLSFGRYGIGDLAGQLSVELERMVIDKTGLKGAYDFRLEYSREGLTPMGGPPTVQDPAPSLFAAVQEQLGLKLESAKEPVDVLVVDSIDKTPTEN